MILRHLPLLFASLMCTFLKAQLWINEYSCSNVSGIIDNFGKREDWIEIYNAGDAALDLTGFYLSDNPNKVTKWKIPGGLISSKGYKMVFCSKRNLTNTMQYHPNFSLKQTEKEWIILSNPLGVVVDSVRLIHLTKADHSVGRSTNGANEWRLFTVPTPNQSNNGAQRFYLPTPVMSLKSGFYSGMQTVHISCSDPTATIRYTVNGATPTQTSTIYTGPIQLKETTVLRAVAFGVDQPSFTETNTYFIGAKHAVPVVSVCGKQVYDLLAVGIQAVYSTGSFELFEDDGSFICKGEGEFNKHGHDSWVYMQRGFDYISRDALGYAADITHQIFPDSERKRFQRLILKPAANDNYPFEKGAHLRDAFAQTLSIRAKMKLDERKWRPCVLYLNGEYRGIYELREKVDDHDFTKHYFNQDKYDIQYFKTWGATHEEYGAPKARTDWNNLVNYIETNNMGAPDRFHFVDSLLNWKSLCDYFIVNSFVVAQDWLNWNTGWWRGLNPLGHKRKWRYTLWDMDATFGHYLNYTGVPDISANANPCNAEKLPNPGGQGHTVILQKLLKENPEVHQYYVSRYADLLNTSFSCDNMNALLDSMLMLISPEMPAQVLQWGGTLTGWQSEVEKLRDFINKRCSNFEQGLIQCYHLTGPFQVIFDVFPANSGRIKVNSIWTPTYPWTTSYFGGVSTKVTAMATPGFVFDHWEFLAGPLSRPSTEDTNSFNLNGTEKIIAVFSPEKPDIDGDGCLNKDEVLAGTNPYQKDTDEDGKDDCTEIGSELSKPLDIDKDGQMDAVESLIKDEDKDGVPDELDPENTDPCLPDPNALPCDLDLDGLINAEEILQGTDPKNPNSDGDKSNDGEELIYGSDPLDACDPLPMDKDCLKGINIPNAFSPNNTGNHANETLKIIVGKDVVRFTLSLFDRWGNLITTSSDKLFEWDGTFRGQACIAGVYVYMVEIFLEDGSRQTRSGNITLIR